MLPQSLRGFIVHRRSQLKVPDRIALVGNAAGGKSTLARAFCDQHGHALLEIDHVQWLPGWQIAPEEAVAAAEADFSSQHARWVIDGWGPWPMIERRFRAADLVVHVDLPIWMHFWHAAERQLQLQRGTAPTSPPGCDLLDVTEQLFATMWRVHTDFRPRVSALLDDLPVARVARIENPAELDALWLRWGLRR